MTPAAPQPPGEPGGFAPPAVRPSPSPRQRLLSTPSRFGLDQAVAVAAPGSDPADVAFRSVPRLGAPQAEVLLPDEHRAELQTPAVGLVGAGGTLPRHYTAWVAAETRQRSHALHEFLDMLSRRLVGLLVKAGAKHRPTRDPALAETVLAASIGLGTPHLAALLHTPAMAFLHHAGALSTRTRSAERLRGLLAEETGLEVQIVEFSGGWMPLPPSEQTRLSAAGSASRLGVDAAAGIAVWDASARFVVRLGPMPLATYRTLLPGTPLFRRLTELTRMMVGLEQSFAFNPVLEAAEVPPLRLGLDPAGSGSQLGWTSWLGTPHPRHRAAADTMLCAADGL